MISNSTTITSNGKEAVSVRVRLNNPGTVSDAVTASAIIGSYSSYGQVRCPCPPLLWCMPPVPAR